MGRNISFGTFLVFMLLQGMGLADEKLIQLSPAEQSWLAKNHVVRVRVGSAPPFLITDGKVRGIAIDYLESIFNQHNIAFEYIQESDVTWPEALRYIEEKRVIDMVPTANITDERKKKMLFTQEYIHAPWVIFSRTDSAFIGAIEDLEGKTVAVEEGFVIHSLLENEYPSINLKVVSAQLENYAELPVRDLSTGLVDAYIGNLIMTTYMIQSRGYTNIKVAAPTPFANHNQAMAVRNDWPELVSIVDKTLAAMSSEEHVEIRNKWLPVRYEHGIHPTDVFFWLLVTGGLGVLFVTFYAFWNNRLKAEINHRRRVEEKLTKFFHTNPSATFVWQASGEDDFILREINEASRKITEGNAAKFLGKKASAINGDLPILPEKLKQCLRERSILEFEHHYKNRYKGEFDWIRFRLAYTEPDTVLLYADAITKQKNAEEALREAQERYDLAMRFTTDGLYDWDLVTNVIWYSPGWKKMLGYEDDELENEFSVWERLTREEDVQESWQMLDEVIQGKRHRFEKEMSMRHREGHWVHILSRANIVFNDKGEAVRVVGTHVDISARKKVENELKFKNAAIENSLNGFVIIDDENRVRYVNKAFTKMWGYASACEIQGSGMIDHFADPGLSEEVMIILRDKGAYEFEFVARRKDGSTFDALMYARLASDEKGNIIYPTTTIDITESKRAQAEEKRLLKKLHQAQKMEAIGNLAGGIAHDFNNILASVIGFTELALADVEKGSELEENLQEVYAAGSRARDLVKQILAFARQTEEEFRPVEVGRVVVEALKMVRSTFPASIEIRQNIGSVSKVLANSIQLHQVILNLCTNGAHALQDEGGILEVTVRDVSLPDSEHLSGEGGISGDYVELTVSDNGGGIDPEIIDKIFEPYFTTKRVGKGTGLGLAMVKGIVESCGGSIIVDSSLADGSVFTILLPVTAEMERVAYEQNSTGRTGGEHILLVDDELAITKVASRLLGKSGYKVTAYTDSKEALECLRASPGDFDLVITDMTMPKMSGDKLSLKIRQIRPDIPIILCTGYSHRMNKEMAEKLGINALAHKPFTHNDLTMTVSEVLNRSQVAQPIEVEGDT